MRLAPGRWVAVVATAVVLSPVLAVWSATPADAATGRVHPGSSVSFGDETCEVGALMHEGRKVYAAIPASCGGIDLGKKQDGCAEAETPVGVPVKLGGASRHGTLVYNSFTEMQLHGQTKSAPCWSNDLALVQLSGKDAGRASGRIPGLHAPSRIASAGLAAGAAITIGSHPATVGAASYHGWAHAATTSASFATSDVGAPVVHGSHLIGMLTVIPAGVLVKSAPEFYSLAKAMTQLHKVRGFRHVTLLRASQRA